MDLRLLAHYGSNETARTIQTQYRLFTQHGPNLALVSTCTMYINKQA